MTVEWTNKTVEKAFRGIGGKEIKIRKEYWKGCKKFFNVIFEGSCISRHLVG
jgi:hypothetical protein